MKRIRKLAVALLLATCACALAGPAHAAAAKPLPKLTPVRHDALSRALASGRIGAAEYALERARSLFDLRAVRARYGHVARADPHDATLILRDLAARMRFLRGEERAAARGLLARPDGRPTFNGEHQYEFDAVVARHCDPTRPLCFHWDENSANADAPPGADGNTATIPNWVTTTMNVFANVWDKEVAAYGYRAPLPDSTTTLNDGGSPDLDIYLANLRPDGLFGYCTTDDPHAYEFAVPWAVSAYCVVDNDFVGYNGDPTQLLDVTAAHEFFHAVQFAYDWFEDFALMEGTAMWMEGEVYPAVLDRIRYLTRSALSDPGVPLDTGSGGFEYGAWLYWRFLSEKVFGDRSIIKQIWERADGSSAAAYGDEYSFQAVKRALAADGLDFRRVFARFGSTNDLRDYSEAALGYPVAPLARAYHLGGGTASTGWQAPRIRHLATRFYRLRPARSAPEEAHLHVRVDLPRLSTGAAATAVVYRKGGAPRKRPFKLRPDGTGHRTLDFGRGQIWKIDLILSNGSVRFDCPAKDDPWTIYSCGGWSRDDNHRYRFRARVR